ncbi:putative hydroxymethylpyrimidine transporter CytX [Actinomycetospora corticicola]|uniref:Putative hydroxymethylpyrimidine transporter CytX n=1 Tax=Actinomycetospora corticicola TaxID=663602 RepID=A0A7Y9J7I4_9PSEU|nr:cytosine permease [Actinomycetospora corticicola]NYD38425.1 putative hydroxymethylpyrimidine transporter CytX [Actinomycetospora corticicola]
MASSSLSTSAPDEVAPTLDGPVPRSLGFLDQGAFWANLGVSLLGFAGVLAVLQPAGAPPLTVAAAVVATVVGTVIGSAMVGLSAIPGARTGAPAMVVLRGLFGGVLSWIPSVLNVVQLIGWGTFELVVIAQAGTLAIGGPTWAWIVGAGVVTTLLTLRPLGMLRLLRRVVTILVAISVAYLAWWLFTRPAAADLGGAGSWSGFWAGTDAAIAVAVSWIPVASDYSRHSKRVSTAFTAATVGYGITQILCFVVGLAALSLVAGDGDAVFAPMLVAPLGVVALLILTLRETDQSFANVYSTAVSAQNLVPRADRRLLCLAIGVIITVLGLVVTIDDYAVFLAVIGSIFVPLLGVGVGEALVNKGRLDLSRWAPSRPLMVVAWVIGLAVYQLINPGGAPVWSDAWTAAREALGFTPPSWLSASLTSFLTAGLVAAAFAGLAERTRRREKIATVG